MQSDEYELDLSEQDLLTFPSAIGYENITSLNCSENFLTELPIGWCHLTSLDFSHNTLALLPKYMPNLTKLDAVNNQLEFVPMNVYNYHKLKFLDLSENHIKILVKPWVLPNTLIELDLRNNSLLYIPGNLPDSISILNLFGNKLTTLPYKLPNDLSILTLSNNRIQNLHDNLPRRLKTLTLENNELQCFPDNLPRMLYWFTYENNKKIDELYPLLDDICKIVNKLMYIDEINDSIRIKNRLKIINANDELIEKAVRLFSRPQNISNFLNYLSETDYYKDKITTLSKQVEQFDMAF